MLTARVRQGLIPLLLMLFVAVPLVACPVCFGDKDSRTTEAATQSIFVLLGCTSAVLGSLIAFAFRMYRLRRLYHSAPPAP